MKMQGFNNVQFDAISLEEMDKVQLMNRMDTKYWFHAAQLQPLLMRVQNEYYALNINGTSQQPYTTTYYDTPCNRMYTDHHNGKLNRIKIRRRTYQSSGLSFLEIKHKNNKGRTIKERIVTDNTGISFSKLENEFIASKTPYTAADLHPALTNSFTRLMLVNKNLNERCTIDFNLSFTNAYQHKNLDELVIVEVKSAKNQAQLPLTKVLRDSRLKPSGFSKYCVGMSITDTSIKTNSFKPKIRALEKTLHTALLQL